jgi:hypothetical protein
MKKTIYLHIGIGKTGTTSIQLNLLNNYNKLLKMNILYPETGITHFGHHLLAHLGAEKMTKEIHIRYKNLIKEIETANCDNIIISSENFIYMKPEYIKEISEYFSEYNVKIIFYIRKQLELFESTYLEWLKVGKEHYGSVPDFFNMHKNSFDFSYKILPWEKYFNKKSFIVRLFDKRIIGNDINADFFNIVDININKIDITLTDTNPSLKSNYVELVHALDNISSIRVEERREIIECLLKLSIKYKATAPKHFLTPELIDEIEYFYKDSNIKFAAKYLTTQEKLLLIE